jgi:hypothetical protein
MAQGTGPGVVLTPEQRRRRRRRSVAIALTLGVLAALFYVITMIKIGASLSGPGMGGP